MLESKRVKRQISAACHYAYTRLVLNYYMYYETVLEGDLLGRRLADLDGRYHGQLKAFLTGEYDLGQLAGLRDEVSLAMEVNTSYTDAFQVYEYALNRLEGRFEPQLMGNRAGVLDEEKMTADILAYITHTDEAVVVNERIQSVLGQLPVRLTRQKFFAMMEEGLSVYKGGSVKSLEDMIYVLRSEAMLNQPEDMETGYEELHSILREFERTDYREMTVEQYRHLTAEMDRAAQILMDTTGEIMLFMDLVNDLYILMLSRPSAMMEITEENRLKEMLSSLFRLFERGASEPIPQGITDGLTFLEGKQEAYFEQWMRQETAREESGGAEEADEEEERLATISLLMSGSSFMSLTPSGDQEDKSVDEAVLREKMELLTEELTASWEDRPKILVRAVMAKLLSRLPIFFGSLDELKLYIEGSLRSCTDVQEKETTMKLIRLLMDQDE